MTDVDYIPAVQNEAGAARANRDRLAVEDAPKSDTQEAGRVGQNVVPGNNALDTSGVGIEKPNPPPGAGQGGTVEAVAGGSASPAPAGSVPGSVGN